MKNRITIKDIAVALNIHHSTVSRALRNDSRVREKTKKRILDYANKNGYQINMSALHLRGSLRNVIAIIVPNINHNFFSNMISLVTNMAESQGYIVSIFQSNESLDQERQIIDTIIQHDIAGVIASVAMETNTSEHYQKLKKYHIPLVLFDRIRDDIEACKVTVNNAEIVFRAVELLVKRGCTKIAHIGGPQQINVFKERHNGYLDGLATHHLSYKESILLNKKFVQEDGQHAVEQLFFDKTISPDALICDSNILLVGVLTELKKRKTDLPTVIQIAAFSDSPFVKAFAPDIICIEQPEKLVAQNSFDQLMKRIKNDATVANKQITIPARIILNQ